MREQATLAMEEADVILFTLDGREGLVPIDLEITEILRRTNKPLVVVANKIEGRSAGTGRRRFTVLRWGRFISSLRNTETAFST